MPGAPLQKCTFMGGQQGQDQRAGVGVGGMLLLLVSFSSYLHRMLVLPFLFPSSGEGSSTHELSRYECKASVYRQCRLPGYNGVEKWGPWAA
jgi:hypothetical protein